MAFYPINLDICISLITSWHVKDETCVYTLPSLFFHLFLAFHLCVLSLHLVELLHHMVIDEVMTMLGKLHGGQGDQQGHPNREGSSKLIRFESPRWRPKSSLSPPRNPEPVCLELVTQDAYGLRFR
jgi:hypothetical protein